MNPDPNPTAMDRFLICGMGSLGQYCLFHLKRFTAPNYRLGIRGIDLTPPQDLEVGDFRELLEGELTLGDCRQEQVLLKAGVRDCRAILLVTSDESVNVQAAIAARRLNPDIRLVVRSSRPRLNRLLEQQLGNFVALESTKLAATAFALEGLGSNIRGVIPLGEHQLQVVEQVISPGDRRFDQLPVYQMRQRHYRLISGARPDGSPEPLPSIQGPSDMFHCLAPEVRLGAGDRVTYIERVLPPEPISWRPGVAWRRWRKQLARDLSQPRRLWRQWQEWLQAQPARPVILLGVALIAILAGGGTILLKLGLPDLRWQTAASTALILLLGGYGDVFGGFEDEGVPVWLQAVSFLITLISLAFVLGGLGLLADRVFSARFSLLRRRPIIPQHSHVIVIGLGRVGQRLVRELQRFRYAVVVISSLPEQPLDLGVPVLWGDAVRLLSQANLETAKSVMIVTGDQLLNLELALTVRETLSQAALLPRPPASVQQPDRIGLVVRTFDQRFSDNLNQLLPDVAVLTVHEIAAEAFAGAAFGEDILALFRLQDRTILVTSYQIERGDTLLGKTIGQVAYGYGVMPIFHRRASQLASYEEREELMPADETRLQEGDRLVVLASIEGLRRIEHGHVFPPQRWQLTIQRPLNPEFLHSGGNTLARVGGVELERSRAFMQTLPNTIELALYPYQAEDLRREIGRQLSIQLNPMA